MEYGGQFLVPYQPRLAAHLQEEGSHKGGVTL